ncbi:MAG TPA: SPOR domain-containing protein, partial [Bradyrhizobium sp.]|nr:SPOR domain-containing protein [Bradyrhizobium sp.]
MADRYQDRPFPADDDHDRRDGQHAPARAAESDPLAELARLIGQNDPFAGMGRANHQVQPRAAERDQHRPPAAPDDAPAASPPPWMQRATRQEVPQRQELPQVEYPEDPPSPVHPVHRYATPRAAAPEPNYHDAPPFAEDEPEPDPSRYDDALYGQADPGTEEPQYDQAEDDPYGYQDGYGDDSAEEEEPVRKRGGGLMTVAIVLGLAVVGTGGAFAYRTYVGSPRTGEPPIIRADAGPTKIVPSPANATSKLPDRMVAGDGTEKIVPREEAPMDVNAKSGPRVVFPSLNQNANPPTPASVASTTLPPASAGNGTLSSNEPRKIRTLSVKGDQPDAAATPVGSTPPPAKPTPATRSVANANASTANAPMPLTPQGGSPPTAAPADTRAARVAAATPTNPDQAAPAPAAAASAGGGYLVQ